jgi:putative ABC transport system permease protein
MHKKNLFRIPAPARWILLVILPDRDQDTLYGDFTEIYTYVLRKKGRLKAYLWLLGQIFKSTPGFFRDSIYGSIDMVKNYLKTAFRLIRRNKIYSFITLFSLAVGFTSGLLILLFVKDELSYDRYHKNADRIYRVYEVLNLQDQKREMAITPAPFGPSMKEEIPQVTEAVRFLPGDFGGNKVFIRHGEERFYEDKWFFADESVFKVFSFKLTEGDSNTVLKAPYTVTLSETKAKKIFGNSDPVGQIITLENQFFKNDFLVTGVFEDIPENSHFTFDFLASFSSVRNRMGNSLDNWFNHMYYTYLLLQEDTAPKDVENNFSALIKKHAGDTGQSILHPRLQALPSIRLHSHLENEIEPNSDASYIVIFLTVAAFIIGIATINFINLTTARSATRAKEVGMRKVMGAQRIQLIKQFLGESVLFSISALILSLGLAYFLLPEFNTLADKNLNLGLFSSWRLPLSLILTAVLIGGLSGVYPALYLSRFVPTRMLKGKQKTSPQNGKFRKGLIIFQFTISIALIVLTFGVKEQLHYIQTKKLGFHEERVVVMPLRDDSIKKQYQALKNELLRNNRVESVSASSGLPGRITHHWWVFPEGWTSGEERPAVWVMMVDHDFISTMGMEILEGRDFSREMTTDEEGILINESARSLFGWKQPLGKKIKTENIEGHVIGIVRDFHFQSFRQAIEPLIIYIYPKQSSFLLVRLKGEDVQAGLSSLKQIWNQTAPNRPFEYFFLDRDFDRFYRSEQRAGGIFGGFALLAVVIALFGLYGLATFTAEQRTKEVGIRKVLGASVPGLIRMLTSEFALLVLAANVIAWPLAYYVIWKWLQNFAYRTGVSLWMFGLAAVLTLGLTLLTVSIQAFRAASTDPVKVLRYE